MGISTKRVTIKGAGGLRIVARLKRGSLFRLLSFMPVRRAPHASCAFDVHTCNTGGAHTGADPYTETPSFLCIHASVRYLATVRCKKQFDLAARSISPSPLSPPLSLLVWQPRERVNLPAGFQLSSAAMKIVADFRRLEIPNPKLNL